MSSLEPAEQKEFMRLLRKFVHLHDRQNKPAVRKTRATAPAQSGARPKPRDAEHP